MNRFHERFSTTRRRLCAGLAAGGLAAAMKPAELLAATNVCLFADEALARYGFPDGHPLGTDRQGAFLLEASSRGLLQRVHLRKGRAASPTEIGRFHTAQYVTKVQTAEAKGLAMLEEDGTPVFPGVFEAAAHVVGAALSGLELVMSGECRRSFQPIGGWHHATRARAAGFCVFNDLGVVIETLRQCYGVRRVAYVDIDVHFGDGVFYAFEGDPDLIFADIHQDGRTLYPGTGHREETGAGAARGTKLNIPLAPGAGDADFLAAWPEVEAHLSAFAPEFVVFQCGADGLGGDPLAGLNYSPRVHAHATAQLRALAERTASGRIMAFGGGGYNRSNMARAWSEVMAALS